MDRLIIEVPTWWNWSYLILEKFLQLKAACMKVCEVWEATKYDLWFLEWEYVQQMCNFFEPFSKANDMLCQRYFPTMHEVIPVYTVIIEGLLEVK